jgi:beta-lactamase class A
MRAQDRRTLLLGIGGLGLLALSGCAVKSATAADPDTDKRLTDALAALEKSSGGKLGAALLDCKDATLVGHRNNERFTMCSTFKLSLAAAVLARIDAGQMKSDDKLPIAAKDLVGHAPVVKAALDKGEKQLDILTLAKAAQTQSDNGAANILLRKIGGPAALTAFWRALGDDVSRLDRYEPELNTSHDGDPRDTTTPSAMANTLRSLLTRPALLASSRSQLIGWMEDTQTGLRRIRGGLPNGWRAGDKTGTMNGAAYPDKTNDLAIIWHPKRAEPFILTGFVEGRADGAEAMLAEVGRVATHWIEGRVT